jgi:anti-sigma B factor antagonist
MNDLKFSIRLSEGIVVVDLVGRIMIGESSSALSMVLHTLVEEGKRRVLLNLADVTALDSTGLGTLVAGYATFEKAAGRLKLLNLSPKIAELLTVTKLYIVFDIFDDEAEAVASFYTIRDQIKQPLETHAVKIVGSDSSIL